MSKSDLTWTDLDSPTPRATPRTYAPIAWRDGARRSLPKPTLLGDLSLAEVLAKRASRRNFAGPPEDEPLSALLNAVSRPVSTEPSRFGFPLEFRPTPSAGALHPIHLLLQPTLGVPWLRYEAATHELIEVAGSKALADAARTAAGELVACPRATVIGFAAEVGRTSVKYAHAESLVWRDAGVLLGYLHLGAEALGLAFTPLGLTGDPYLRDLDGQGRLRGVGMALVGVREG